MTKLRDGGGIYVNGWTNPSYRNTMSHNWCDADAAVFAIYYLDNGSSRWDVYQNVGTNSPLPWCYFMTGDSTVLYVASHTLCWFNSVLTRVVLIGGGGPSGKASNSSISWLWCKDTSLGRNDCPDLGCTVDNSTVLYVEGRTFSSFLLIKLFFFPHVIYSYLKASDPLPNSAQSIVDSSGCRLPPPWLISCIKKSTLSCISKVKLVQDLL